MKKVILALAVVCSVALVSCSNKDKEAADTNVMDTPATEEVVDTNTVDTPVAEEAKEEVKAEEAPATEEAAKEEAPKAE